MKLHLSVAAWSIALVVGLSACNLGPTSKERPTSAGTSRAASAASSATTAPRSAATTPGRHPYCSGADKFCIVFTVSMDMIGPLGTTTPTKTGKRPARSYGHGGQLLLVYTPAEADPWAALYADRSWDYSPRRMTFKGNPALLVVEPADHQASNIPFRDVVLKVWHRGKIYWVMMAAPRGLSQAKVFYDTLSFT